VRDVASLDWFGVRESEAEGRGVIRAALGLLTVLLASTVVAATVHLPLGFSASDFYFLPHDDGSCSVDDSLPAYERGRVDRHFNGLLPTYSESPQCAGSPTYANNGSSSGLGLTD